MSGTVVYSSDGEWRQRQFTGSGRLGRRSNSVYGGVLWRTDQRPEHRMVAGYEAGCMLQQIGLERGDLVCAGAGRPSQDRPSRRGGRCVRPLWCCFVTLKCELPERRSSRSHAEARMAIFEFVEGFYNGNNILG